MNVSLKSLRYFASALELGNISKAAERLNVVPSAVAAAIDQVEAEFSLQLVTRHRAKGIAPTSEGLALLPKVRRLLEDYDVLLSEGGDLKGAISGEVKIGYYAPVAPAFLPELLAPLQSKNPELRFRFEECDSLTAQAGLMDGRFDVIFFVAESIRQGVQYETLLEAPAYLLTGAHGRLVGQHQVSIDDLRGEPLIILDLPIVGDYYRSLLEDAGVSASIAATCTSTEMVRSLIGAGYGSAILNMRPRTNTSYGGHKLVSIPIEPKVRPLRLLIGYHTGQKRRAVEQVIEVCREAFASGWVSSLTVRAGTIDQA